MQRRDQHPTVPAETVRQVFDVFMRPTNRAAAEASAPRAAQKNANEQTQRLLELLDSDDKEHRSELDVYQIGKYLQPSTTDARRGERQAPLQQDFPENTNKVSRPEFIAFDKYIRDQPPGARGEPVALQLRALRRPVHGRLARLAPLALPRPDTLHDRDVPPATRLCRALNAVPPEDEFHLLTHSQIFSDLSVLFVTARHSKNVLRTRQGEKAKAIKQPIMTAALAFNVDTLLFVEPGKGGLRKRLNRHIFCYSMQQLGDDDLLFSTRPFNAAGTRVLQDAVALTPTAAVLPTLSLGRLTVAAQPEQIVLDMIRSFAVEFFVDVVARLCSDGVVVRTTALLDAPLLRRGRARAPRRLEHVASRAPHLIFAASNLPMPWRCSRSPSSSGVQLRGAAAVHRMHRRLPPLETPRPARVPAVHSPLNTTTTHPPTSTPQPTRSRPCTTTDSAQRRSSVNRSKQIIQSWFLLFYSI